ncbi:hypothetical protein [Candidatus Borrarchaeum sp.]|uniref:hypothetical protein n=1 Tax=Candidatus Borrarchaeum sp. TaxID=2846742 RepID=UPI002579669F|nr:hypothetical protein [Candidatus Borrarchaeum sp.]
MSHTIKSLQKKKDEAVGTKEYSELPRAKASRLPASTTDSIPLWVTEVLSPQA